MGLLLPSVEWRRTGCRSVRCSRRSRAAARLAPAISLAHDLGLTVTAEGVETPSALDCLRELGCDHVQGYVIARPMPAADVTRWIRTWQGKARQPDL